jgi:hypothetical protein
MSWQQIGDLALDITERLDEPRVLKLIVYHNQEPRVFKIPVAMVEQQSLIGNQGGTGDGIMKRKRNESPRFISKQAASALPSSAIQIRHKPHLDLGRVRLVVRDRNDSGIEAEHYNAIMQ